MRFISLQPFILQLFVEIEELLSERCGYEFSLFFLFVGHIT